MSEREFIIPDPVYPTDLHPTVLGEVREAWTDGRPYSPIRELRKGVDASEGAQCGGSQGNGHLECKLPVEGVQYSSAFGSPMWYCEKHALDQFEWDKILAGPPKPTPPLTKEQEAMITKLLEKKKPKKKKDEPEPLDPMS